MLMLLLILFVAALLTSLLVFVGTLSGTMNYILRATQIQPVAPELPSVDEVEPQEPLQPISKPVTTLEGLIAEDPYPNHPTNDDIEKDNEGSVDASAVAANSGLKNHVSIGNHFDVTEDEGWIMIPCGMTYHAFSLPENQLVSHLEAL